MEHFHDPSSEFKMLKNLLLPNGKLYCLTHLYHSGIAFDNWYYKNDDTHVSFYSKITIDWIAKTFGLKTLEIEDRLVIFQKIS